MRRAGAGLKLGGVGPAFTLSGHQILPIYDAGIDEDLRFVDTRHEGAAVHMADGWGRLTGRDRRGPGDRRARAYQRSDRRRHGVQQRVAAAALSGGAEVPNSDEAASRRWTSSR